MELRQRFIAAAYAQFGRPTGFWGRAAGLVMAHRSSNRRRNAWAVSLLDVRPDDRVLEIGFGPGLAIRELSRLAAEGRVCGIDHSELMLRRARRLNAEGVARGVVDLRLGSVEDLPAFDEPFDKILAVNAMMFWREPVARLEELRRLLRSGGVIALAHQPRGPGASDETAAAKGRELQAALTRAGFSEVRLETLPLKPAVVCALGVNPDDEGASTDAKVVRIWRTSIDPARADEYDEFARTRSLPMFRAQAGFVAVAFTSRGSERAVITFWEDWDSVDALGASASYEATVKEIEAAGFLRGEQSVEAFAVDGMFTRRGPAEHGH